MKPQLVQFPERNLQDIPGCLRRLADAIDNGEYAGLDSFAWVMDCRGGDIRLGLAGGTEPHPGTEAYYLFGLAQRKLEQQGK